MCKVNQPIVCGGCVSPVAGIECTGVDIGVNANLELVHHSFTIWWRNVSSF